MIYAVMLTFLLVVPASLAKAAALCPSMAATITQSASSDCHNASTDHDGKSGQPVQTDCCGDACAPSALASGAPMLPVPAAERDFVRLPLAVPIANALLPDKPPPRRT